MFWRQPDDSHPQMLTLLDRLTDDRDGGGAKVAQMRLALPRDNSQKPLAHRRENADLPIGQQPQLCRIIDAQPGAGDVHPQPHHRGLVNDRL